MRHTILLADDHPAIRRGLIDILKEDPFFVVIGEASTGKEALDLVSRLKPDILLLDLRMPVVSGIDVLRKVKQSAKKTKVIILSMYGTEPYVLETLRMGADGFIVKDSVPSEILKALHEVSEGKKYLSPSISEFVINAYIRKNEEIAQDSLDQLTPREREVFQLVAEGLGSADIAAQLLISPRTVEVHRLNLMRKLGLHNQSELIRFAIKKGLLLIEPPEEKANG